MYMDNETEPGKGKPKKSARGTRTKSAAKNKGGEKRLRPGELDALVLDFMKSHRSDLPLTAGAIAREIGRSGGAVTNCLARLAERGEVRIGKRKPRAYLLKEK